MPTTLFLGGIFNIVDPIIGWQLYIWSWIALVVFAIFAWIGWYFGGWKPYKPFWGIWYAYKAGSNAAIIGDAALICEMISERVAKCIFDYSKEEYDLESPLLDTIKPLTTIFVVGWFARRVYNNVERVINLVSYYPTAYLKNITPLHALVYKFGGVNKDVEIARHLQNGEWERYPSIETCGVDVEIIIDTDNWTIRDSRQHKAIEREARAWNKNNPTDQVHTYAKFQQKLQAGDIICPEVKKEFLVDWTRINRGFTTNMEASEYVGKTIQMSEQEYNVDTVLKNKIGFYILGGCIGIGALIIVARVAMHFIH